VLEPGTDFDKILGSVRYEFRDMMIDERDGLRVDLPDGWFQIRKSNTEPIMRIYAEKKSQQEAEALAEKVITIVKKK